MIIVNKKDTRNMVVDLMILKCFSNWMRTLHNLRKFDQRKNKIIFSLISLNPFSANSAKRSNKPQKFVSNLPTRHLSVFDHFVGLALEGLKHFQT